MPPPLLFDPDEYDLTHVIVNREQLYERLPHRGEFMLLDGVLVMDTEAERIVAFADIQADAWWATGHFPGRPILPGVCLLEMAGQAAWYYTRQFVGHRDVLAFAGVDTCRFRGTVAPPCRVLLLGVSLDIRPRRCVCAFQAVVNGKIVFEGELTGIPIRSDP